MRSGPLWIATISTVAVPDAATVNRKQLAGSSWIARNPAPAVTWVNVALTTPRERTGSIDHAAEVAVVRLPEPPDCRMLNEYSWVLM